MDHAETLRENVNGFIDQAIDETMNGTKQPGAWGLTR